MSLRTAARPDQEAGDIEATDKEGDDVSDDPAEGEAAEQEEDGDDEVDDGGKVWWWRRTDPGTGDQYLLRWESAMLMELKDTERSLWMGLGGSATYQVVTHTAALAMQAALAAIALPYTLISAASMIDGTWTLVVERADEAGRLLAEVLLKREQGARPVTLVGFSMGARLIFSCLKELARHHDTWLKEHHSTHQLKRGRLTVRLPPTPILALQLERASLTPRLQFPMS
eukprot:gene10359-12252_t